VGGSGAVEAPDVAFHIVAGDHPEVVVGNKDAGSVTRLPGGVRYFKPLDAIGGVPDIVRANEQEMWLVARIPAANEPPASAPGKRAY
jgi:hypothetical protein